MIKQHGLKGFSFNILKRAYCKTRQTFWRVPNASSVDGTLRLHLGCGPINAVGYINIDFAPMRHVHLMQSVERLRRFQTGSVDLIYASHVLEHISHQNTLLVLREWARALKPGGTLRIAVPDFDALVRIYALKNRAIPAIQGMLFGGQDYPGNAHFTAFNSGYLAQLLVEAGFEIPKKWGPIHDEEPFRSDHSGLEVDVDGEKILISLNLEAVRCIP
jgi:predicted SAM-dependent methyltransferase